MKKNLFVTAVIAILMMAIVGCSMPTSPESSPTDPSPIIPASQDTVILEGDNTLVTSIPSGCEKIKDLVIYQVMNGDGTATEFVVPHGGRIVLTGDSATALIGKRVNVSPAFRVERLSTGERLSLSYNPPGKTIVKLPEGITRSDFEIKIL